MWIECACFVSMWPVNFTRTLLYARACVLACRVTTRQLIWQKRWSQDSLWMGWMCVSLSLCMSVICHFDNICDMLISEYVCALNGSSFEQINHTHNKYIQIPLQNECAQKTDTENADFLVKRRTFQCFFCWFHSFDTMNIRRLQFDELWVLWVPIEFTRLNYERRHMNASNTYRTLNTQMIFDRMNTFIYMNQWPQVNSAFFSFFHTKAAAAACNVLYTHSSSIFSLTIVFTAYAQLNNENWFPTNILGPL